MLSSLFYKCFVEIAESGNISSAAEKLNYSQGGLSHLINRAEAELGIKLFKRTKYGVALTEEGRQLLPYARQTVFNMQKMDELVAALHGLDVGHIRIGTYASISMHFFPDMLVAFTRDYPGISIEVVEALGYEIEQYVTEQTIDIGFTSFYGTSQTEKLPLFKDPMVIVCPKDMNIPTDENGCFPLEYLKRYKFILGKDGHGIDPDIEAAIGNNLPSMKTGISSLDYVSIMCMVRSGLGISLLPRLITLDYVDDVKVLEIAPKKYRTVGIEVNSRDSISAATSKFVEYVRNYTSSVFLPRWQHLGYLPGE